MRSKALMFLALAFPLLCGWGHWGPKVKIGLSLDRAQGRLVQQFQETVDDNRAELVAKVAEGDPKLQATQVKELIAQGIEVLVLRPCDPAKSSSLIEAAHRANLQVLLWGDPVPGADYLVSFDDAKAGELQAKAMLKLVPRGNYLLWGKTLREGQMKALKGTIENGDIHVSFESAGSKDKNLAAILTDGNGRTDQALGAVKKNGRKGQVLVAGATEDLTNCQSLQKGDLALTLYHSPKKLAVETAYLAAKLARKATQFDCQFVDIGEGEKKTRAVYLTPKVIEAKDLESTVIADGVWTKEEIFGKQ